MNRKNLSYNRPQTNFLFNLHKIRDGRSVWGRGTGKSFIISRVMDMILKKMPRSTWSIQGATFQQLLTRTLPGTFEALELLGYVRDRDYFVNKMPPKGSILPYYKPLKADNYIFLRGQDNYCVGFNLLSQDRSSSRGTSTDGIICDESLLLNIEEFNQQVVFTNRGHENYFGRIPWHHAIFHFSSMPSGDSFLFKNDGYYREDGFHFTAMREQLIDLQLEFCRNRDPKSRMEIYSQMLPIMDKLQFYPKNGKYYSEYNIFDNIENLTLRYIDDMYDNTPEHIFLVEGLNKRVNKIVNGFYPTLNRNIHGYKGKFNYSYLDNLEMDLEKLRSVNSLQDEDCNADEPLHIGLDFGTAINWMIVGQENKRAGEFNFIKNFYVKFPKIIDHLVAEFTEYYKHHKRKMVYIYPDAQGNWRVPNKEETFVQTIVRLLKTAGWQTITVHNKTYNKEQHDTHLLWARLLLGRDKNLPKIGFNLINCKELVYSMEQTPAYDHQGRIKKNKGSEAKLVNEREKATDAGDAADQIIYYKYSYLLKQSRSGLDAIFI